MSAQSILIFSFICMALWGTARALSARRVTDFLLFLLLVVASTLQQFWALFAILPWYFYLSVTNKITLNPTSMQNAKLPNVVLWSALLVTAMTLLLQASRQSFGAAVQVLLTGAAIYIVWDLTLCLRRPQITWRDLIGYRLITLVLTGLVTLIWIALDSELTFSKWMQSTDAQTWWVAKQNMSLGGAVQILSAAILTFSFHLPVVKSLLLSIMRLLKIAATFGILLPKLVRNLAMAAMLILYLTSLTPIFPALIPYRTAFLATLVWLLFAATLHSYPIIRQLRLALLLAVVVSVGTFMDNNIPAWAVILGVSFFANILFQLLESKRPETLGWNVDNAKQIWESLPRPWQAGVLVIPVLVLGSPLYFISQSLTQPSQFLSWTSFLILSMQITTFAYMMHLWTTPAESF